MKNAITEFISREMCLFRILIILVITYYNKVAYKLYNNNIGYLFFQLNFDKEKKYPLFFIKTEFQINNRSSHDHIA